MAAKRFGGGAQSSFRDFQAAMEAVARDLPFLAVAFGECDFLRGEAANRFRNAWLEKNPGGDIVTIRGLGEGRPVSLADVTGELAGASLFAKEKLIIVRQAERLLFPGLGKKDESAEPREGGGSREKGFVHCLDKPPRGIWLFLETSQLPKNRTLGKRLAAEAAVVPCPSPTQRDIPVWLSGRARDLGIRMDDAAMDLLMRAHGPEMGVLAGELDKLALFAGEGGTVDAAAVGEFLTGRIEFDIFGFTNAVEARDADRAVFFARRIALQGTRDQRGKKEDGEKSAHRVLSMLAGTVQSLLRANVARARRLDSAEFAAAEKLSPWRADKLYAAAAKFQLRELRTMARMAADQLRRVHDTGGDPLLALETMAVRFTRGSM